MDILSNFSENLSALLDEKNLSVEEFAASVDIAYSEVYRYLHGEFLPKLSNIIKIADRYNESIDYLLGFRPLPEHEKFCTSKPFSQRLNQLLAQRKISRYRLAKDTHISINRIDDWYHGKFIPSLEKAIILSRYFDCTIDFLFGRE